jgi:hypothetical protein
VAMNRARTVTLIAAASLVATAAIAQSGKRPSHRPKPAPAAAVDAGAAETKPAEDSSEQPIGGSAPVTAAPTADAGKIPPSSGPVPAPAGRTEGDGGVKASPLNPAANEMPGSTPLNVDAGTVDYDRILGDIAALRARVSTVADNLFHSRVAISVLTDNDHAHIGRLAVSLDDGVVYTSQPNFRADSMTLLYSRAVAPGRHAVTVDIDRRDARNDAFRSTQRSRFTVDVVKDEQLDVEIKVIDDSDMGADFPGDKSGDYDLRVRVKAVSHAVKK